jgi:hypothetical protein
MESANNIMAKNCSISTTDTRSSKHRGGRSSLS